ncbi:MAG: hypothetical protein ACTSP4_17630, partial [Candidatus Hodarchaeales archaeon]
TGSIQSGHSESIQFNSTYSFWLYWNSTDDGTPLNASVIEYSAYGQYFTMVTSGNGYHNFTFRAGEFHSFVVTITLRKTDYRSASFDITFNVNQADSEITDFLLAPQPVQHVVYYSDQLSFWVIWKDVRGNVITGTVPVSNLPEFIIFTGETSGNYSFVFDASVIDDYSFIITFSDDKFISVYYALTITVNPAESSFIDLTEPDGGVISGLLYLNTKEFNITWYDERHDRLLNHTVVGSNILGNGTRFITVLSIENGRHGFLINCTIVGTFSIDIVFSMANYTTSTYHLTFIVSPIPTDDPIFVQSLPNSTITGNTVSTVCSWFDLSENEPYPEGAIIVSSGSIILTVDILVTSPGTYTLNISTSGLSKGVQEIQIRFELYGHVNRSISANVTILGHTVEIEFTDVILYSLSSGSTVSYYSAYYQQQHPVAGEEVSFEIQLEHENGSIMVFSESILTDSNGLAIYEIPGTVTQNAVSVTKVSASYEGSAFNNPLSLDYSIPGGVLPIDTTFLAEDLINLLISLSPAIITGLTGLFFVFIWFLRKQKKKKTIMKIRASATRRILDICSINTIFCRHVDGITFYNEDLYGESGDTDAIAGMSTAITAFIDDVAGKLSAGKGIERMERGKFAMLSYQGNKATLTVISKGRVSVHLEKMLESALKEIEKVFAKDLDKFYASDQINAKIVKKIVRKHIPLGLLDAFTLDVSKIPLLEKKLSKKQKAVIQSIRHAKTDIQSSIPIYFLGSLQRQLRADHDIDLANQI